MAVDPMMYYMLVQQGFSPSEALLLTQMSGKKGEAQQPEVASPGKMIGAALGGGGLSSLFGGGTAPAATEAANAAFNAPAGIATNAAWNSAATGGEVLPEVALEGAGTDITNFAGGATPYLGAAGTALGAYGAYKGIKNKNPLGAGLGGAGAALGLNAMGLALGPVGWAAMAGVPAIAALANKWGDKDRWKTEGDRIKKLREKGINVAQSEAEGLTRGRSKDELVAIENDKIAKGQYGNPTFAKSRNEKDLKAEDIWGYSAFYDKFGNDWLGKFSEQQRRDIANAALAKGAVNEHHGTIDLRWNPDLEAETNKILGVIPKAPTTPETKPMGGNVQNLPLTITGPTPKIPDAMKPFLRSSTSSPGISKTGQRINYSIPRRAA